MSAADYGLCPECGIFDSDDDGGPCFDCAPAANSPPQRPICRACDGSGFEQDQITECEVCEGWGHDPEGRDS